MRHNKSNKNWIFQYADQSIINTNTIACNTKGVPKNRWVTSLKSITRSGIIFMKQKLVDFASMLVCVCEIFEFLFQNIK